jgi:TIR domain
MSRQTSKIPTAFISYAWEDDTKSWVQEFASLLRNDGVDARIDRWDMALGDHLTEYMEKSIRDNDFVLIICTPLYKLKSDSREGGVGYEGHIITGEVYANANHRKFIPILIKADWARSAPSFLKSKLYCDLRGDPCSKENYQELVDTLNGRLAQPPPIGSVKTSFDSPSSNRSSSLDLSDGAAILDALRSGLPQDLSEDENANGDIVFVDSDGLQRVKVYEYQSHCKVRVRCSRDWGFRECRHRKNHRNTEGWLTALRVEDPDSLQQVLDLYALEWGNCDP